MSSVNQAFIRAYSKNKPAGTVAAVPTKQTPVLAPGPALRVDPIQSINTPHVMHDSWLTSYSDYVNITDAGSAGFGNPSTLLNVDSQHTTLPRPHVLNRAPTRPEKAHASEPSQAANQPGSNRKTLSVYLQQARSGAFEFGSTDPLPVANAASVDSVYAARLAFSTDNSDSVLSEPVRIPDGLMDSTSSQVWYQEAWTPPFRVPSPNETKVVPSQSSPVDSQPTRAMETHPTRAMETHPTRPTIASDATLVAVQKVEAIKAAMDKLSTKDASIAFSFSAERERVLSGLPKHEAGNEVGTFQAVWEVDRLYWPDVTTTLCSHAESNFAAIGQHLLKATATGLNVLLVTSLTRGEGRSTVALCLARSASQAGLRVALVDGDLSNPTLADHLNLETMHTWPESIMTDLAVGETAIHALQEQITFFPSASSIDDRSLRKYQTRIGAMLRRLSQSFDLVVIDGDPIDAPGFTFLDIASTGAIDAAVMVVAQRDRVAGEIDDAISYVRQRGISSIGIVENFQ